MPTDSLGDQQKAFEVVEAGRMLTPGLPIMVRLDGKAWHTFCRGLKKPFDERLSGLMGLTSKFIAEETNALLIFTQSDEITLVIHKENAESQVYFDGKIQKLTSVISSMATAYFNKHLPQVIPEKADKMAFFDCRVWNLPSLEEVSNNFLWRELDASKNAISMAAQHFYSHKQLHEKNSSEKIEMLYQKGVNFQSYPTSFRRGSYFRRVTRLVKFTSDELEKLPLKHEARSNPDLMVVRNVVEQVNLPPLSKISNRVGVLFKGEEPIMKESNARP